MPQKNQNNIFQNNGNFAPPLSQMNQLNQMNQYIMNLNPESLYVKNSQQTWLNMQPSMNLLNVNFNNMSNILSLLNLPIIVPCHSQHPLINCLTVGRIGAKTYWICTLNEVFE
jgi:hypothetical protein